MTLQQEIEALVSAAIREAFPEAADAPALVTPATDPKFGDYQSNVAMGLKKRVAGKSPRDIAAAIVAKLTGSPAASAMLETPEIAGPGFINLRIRPAVVAARLTAAFADDRLGVPPAEKPKTYVIDFSSPNVAKPMHVGHIRSTIIGDSLGKLLRFLGHTVIGDNHIGDWGTQFGMLIVGYRNHLDKAALEKDPIEELVRIYRLVSERAKADEAVKAAARAELVKLQAGDPDNLALWKRFIDLSMREFDKIYRRLNVKFDCVLGESFYNPLLAGVVEDLKAKGLATESDEAWCVFLEEPGLPKTPFIVQKRDGAFNYAATDLATIKHRVENLKADAALYVVGSPQADHFKQLFATARKWGYDKIDLRHIEFGSVLGEDGKLLRTRSGDTVRLEELLDEAEERALAIVKELRPELAAEEQKKIGTAVGVAAVKYADLMQNRATDYKFSMAKMVALEGNTAPYLMMQYVRARSIFRKAGVTAEQVRASAASGPYRLEHPAELTLAKKLLRLPETVEAVVADLRPNILATYLYELAQSVSVFYQECHVLNSEGETRRSRLMICDHFARTLRLGLGLLGIPTIEQM